MDPQIELTKTYLAGRDLKDGHHRHKTDVIMCSTNIQELREILKKASAQLKYHVLLTAPYIADDIPYTFHTHDTFELLMDLSDLLKAATIQVDKLQALDSIALSIIEDRPTIDIRRSTDSSKTTVTESKELVEDCSQTEDLNVFTESTNRMVDVQHQTETGRDGISISTIVVDVVLDQHPQTNDSCSEGDSRADGQPSRTPDNRNEPCLSPNCRVDTRTDVGDKCCHTCTSICVLPSVSGIRQILCPTAKNVISQTNAMLEGPTESIEVDVYRPQTDKNFPVVEAIKETKEPRASLVHTCDQSIKQGVIDGTQNLVPNGFTNPFDPDEDKDATSTLLDQIPMVKDTELIDHPVDSKQHTSESLVPKVSTTKKRLKPSHKSRRAPDLPQSEVLKRQHRLQEANKLASALFISDTKITGSDDIEYPVDLNPFQDDAIPVV